MARINRVLGVALVAGAIVAAGFAFVGAEEGVLLAYGFAEGYTNDYQVKFNNEVDFGSFAMSQIVDMDVTEKCTGKEGDLFVMELVFNKVESVRMQFDNMVEDPTGERLTGHSVTFKVDANGETSDMRPVDYIEGWEQMARVIQSLVENWYAYLPNKSVKVGDGWEEVDEPKTQGDLKVTGHAAYRFKEIKDEKGCACARVEADTENTVTGSQDTPTGTMIVEGGGKGDVEFFFCPKSASIVKYKAKTEMKMDMTPEGGGDAAESTIGIMMERHVK